MDTATVKVTKDAKLTPKPDKEGVTVRICVPDWFDEKKLYKIENAPLRTASLQFSGADLNYMVRVLYAEASGSDQLESKEERDKEKQAILNVKHFRLNRREYPDRSYIAKTFREVCDARKQFESVFKNTSKFVNSLGTKYQTLPKKDCADLDEAIEATKLFLSKGPDVTNYLYDNFRGYKPGGAGDPIGRSRFWLSTRGKELYEKTP